MKNTIYNIQQWELHKTQIEQMINDKIPVSLSYEKASKEKTKKQIGFFFAALCDQITTYLRDCGFNVDNNDTKYGLYSQVSQIVPEMCVDTIFGNAQRILHISDMDRSVMSKFIDGVFQVIDNNPMYSGLKLTPDVRYNWVFHLESSDIDYVRGQEYSQHDESYLDYIREQPCIICGVQHRSEAHHLKDMELCGMAQKAPDAYALPLCHKCHMNIAHNTGFKDSLRWIPIDLKDFCRLCYSRWKNNL